MDNPLSPEEPKDLNAHDRLREQIMNLVDQVWTEGRRNKDGINAYVDRIMELCGDEARKALPKEYEDAMRQLFEKEDSK